MTNRVRIGGQYRFAYPHFSNPADGPEMLLEHAAHRGQVVTVVRAQTSNERDIVDLGPGYIVRAADGWEGEVEPSELNSLRPRVGSQVRALCYPQSCWYTVVKRLTAKKVTLKFVDAPGSFNLARSEI